MLGQKAMWELRGPGRAKWTNIHVYMYMEYAVGGSIMYKTEEVEQGSEIGKGLKFELEL